MSILDSGTRRVFKSGATRDIQEGKGRCDLLPLDVISWFFGNAEIPKDPTLVEIESYVRTGDFLCLLRAVATFARNVGWDMCTALIEVSKHYDEGAKKYAERNWEKGIPLHCYIDSGVRHYLKFLRGDTDEPHDRAFIWNMLGAVYTQQNLPEYIDLPFNEGNKCVASAEVVDEDQPEENKPTEEEVKDEAN